MTSLTLHTKSHQGVGQYDFIGQTSSQSHVEHLMGNWNQSADVVQCTLDRRTCDFQLFYLFDFNQALQMDFANIGKGFFEVFQVFSQNSFALLCKQNIDISISNQTFDFQFTFGFILSRDF